VGDRVPHVQKRSLADRDYVYVWVDGVHFNVRLGMTPLARCEIGVQPYGTKELNHGRGWLPGDAEAGRPYCAI